jgi:hypothetical protein
MTGGRPENRSAVTGKGGDGLVTPMPKVSSHQDIGLEMCPAIRQVAKSSADDVIVPILKNGSQGPLYRRHCGRRHGHRHAGVEAIVLGTGSFSRNKAAGMADRQGDKTLSITSVGRTCCTAHGVEHRERRPRASVKSRYHAGKATSPYDRRRIRTTKTTVRDWSIDTGCRDRLRGNRAQARAMKITHKKNPEQAAAALLVQWSRSASDVGETSCRRVYRRPHRLAGSSTSVGFWSLGTVRSAVITVNPGGAAVLSPGGPIASRPHVQGTRKADPQQSARITGGLHFGTGSTGSFVVPVMEKSSGGPFTAIPDKVRFRSAFISCGVVGASLAHPE